MPIEFNCFYFVGRHGHCRTPRGATLAAIRAEKQLQCRSRLGARQLGQRPYSR